MRSRNILLRNLKILCGIAASMAIISGCGGSSTVVPPTINTSTRVVVGYVYVATGLIAVTPETIITNSSTPPAGYAAPTAGTITLFVVDGVITRASDTEVFNMTGGNQIIATVTSNSVNTPQVRYSGTGLQYNGNGKPAIPNTNLNMGGTNGSLLTLNYNDSELNYVPGPVASLEVKIKDPNGSNVFEIPSVSFANIVPSISSADDYQVAVIAKDANGIIIPETQTTMTDANSNTTETAVAQNSNSLSVVGGGVEGVDVAVSFGVAGTLAIQTVVTTNYTYGNANEFTATINPGSTSGAPTRGLIDTGLIWPVIGSRDFDEYYTLVKNKNAVPVPGTIANLNRLDTAGTSTGNSWNVPTGMAPPIPNNVFSYDSDDTTGSDGRCYFTLLSPSPVVGDPLYNTANIKYTPNDIGNRLQVRNVNGTVIGRFDFIVTRPLDSLNITGASRLDVNTSSVSTGANAYKVANGVDVDSQSVPAPAGPFTWTVSGTPLSTMPIQVGDPDNRSNRSVAAPTGSSTSSSIVIGAGPSPGQINVLCAQGSVESNILITEVYGAPSKVLLSATPSSTGYFFSPAGGNNTITVSYIDSFGHSLGSEVATISKAGTVNSNGSTLTFPNLPSLNYDVTTPSSGTTTATFTLSGTWTGTGQGTTTGSSNWNLSRTVNIQLD